MQLQERKDFEVECTGLMVLIVFEMFIGNDKLAPYGFYISAGIDGWSHYLL